MHLDSIFIKNFRLFEDLSLRFNSGLNVIVGENNSGKTALVDAIRLTLDTTSSEWTRIEPSDFHGTEKHFHIQIKFADIKPEQAAVFVEHLTHETDEEGNKNFALYVNLKADITDILKRGHQYIRTELRSGAHAEGPLLEREIREYLSATYLRPLRDAESELNAGRNSRLSQILLSAKEFKDSDGGAAKNLIEQFIEANKNVLQNDGVKSTSLQIDENLQNLIFQQDKDKFKLAIQILGNKEFGLMSSSEKKRALQDIIQKLSLVLDPNQPIQGLGYNNVLFMAAELLLLEQEQDKFPLLLIEEPEAHLHPQLQMKFLSFIREEYSKSEEHTLQTIITTHSPNLASKAQLESIILMKDGKAFPLRSGETELESDDYVFLEKFLDVTKANLFFAKGVLIVEGDAENILLPTVAKCIGHPLQDYGVSIVNVGNTSYSRFAKIFGRRVPSEKNVSENWLSTPVACLRDLDLWPLKADKNIDSTIGWKEVKPKNKLYWLPRTYGGGIIGVSPILKKHKLEKFSQEVKQGGVAASKVWLQSQNVKVYVSDEWTFEYCLIRSGLDEMIWGIVGDEQPLRSDEEEKAIQIYKHIETKSGVKTEVAYKLAFALEEKYDPSKKADRDELLRKLPNYIKEAFKHVMALPTLEKEDDAPSAPATLVGEQIPDTEAASNA